MTGDADRVVVMLGIDEHALTIAARRFAADAGVEGTIAGLYTKLVAGLNGFSKMSKRLPGSAISLEMDPDVIRDRIRDRGTSTTGRVSPSSSS